MELSCLVVNVILTRQLLYVSIIYKRIITGGIITQVGHSCVCTTVSVWSLNKTALVLYTVCDLQVTSSKKS